VTKAYIVSCRDDDHGQVVAFTENAKAARQRGNGEACDCGYIELSARRAPELDQYAATGVTMRTLVEKHGWFTLCHSCETQVFGNHAGAVWAEQDRTVYCGPRCFNRSVTFWKGHVNCPAYLKDATLLPEPPAVPDDDEDDDLPKPGKAFPDSWPVAAEGRS
jgi:hypothetical protein